MSDATIHDVARAAGVSAATVSRALNGGKVKDATRERVRKAASELDYQPNTVARDLISGRSGSGNVGVLLTDVGNFYFTDVLKGLFSVAQAAGYRVFVADIDDVADRDSLVSSVCGASEGQILVAPRMSDEDLGRFAPENTVLVSREYEGFSCVMNDDASGMMQAVRHLASLGHRRIAYASGAARSWSNQVRVETFCRACEQYGLQSVVLGPFEPSYAGGRNVADAVTLEQDVTGVIAFNDLMASGLLSGLLERGISVPGDISLVGVDDSMLSQTLRPQLTSVGIRQERVGSLAMQMLLDMLDAKRDGAGYMPQKSVVPEILIARNSTGVSSKRSV